MTTKHEAEMDGRAMHMARVDLIVAGCEQHKDIDAALAEYLRTLAPEEFSCLRPEVAAVVERALAMEVSHRRDSVAALADIVDGATLMRCVTLAAVVERVLTMTAAPVLATAGDPDADARRARGNNGGYV